MMRWLRVYFLWTERWRDRAIVVEAMLAIGLISVVPLIWGSKLPLDSSRLWGIPVVLGSCWASGFARRKLGVGAESESR